MSRRFRLNPRLPLVLAPVVAAAALLFAATHVAAAEIGAQDPCALLDASDYAQVLPRPSGPLESRPYIGRRSSECLWTDPQGQRSLRLVLHPTRDPERPLAQLERLRTADPQALTLEVSGRPAVLTGDRSQLSVAVGRTLLSLVGSTSLQPVGAQALASKVIDHVLRAEPQP